MTKKLLILLSIITTTLVLTGCGLFERELTTNELIPQVIGESEFSFEVFSEEPEWTSFVTASDYLDGVIEIEEYMIDLDNVDMNTVGSFDVTYSVTNSRGALVEYTMAVSIVDTIPPEFTINDITIYTSDIHIDWTTYITDPTDNYYTDFVYRLVEDNVEYDTVGVYTVSVKVRDGSNNEKTKTFYVTVIEYGFAHGFYNYRFADSELRHTFMAAAEKYLMNNMYGGVPIFTSGSFVMYSHRLRLPVDEYIAVMGYGPDFGWMTADDSTVTMYDGLPGNIGEYTYRTTINNNPGTFNQWLYDNSTDSTLMDKYIGSLYFYTFNEDLNGYNVEPSMASGEPIPIDSEITENGIEVADKWSIPLRNDLVWKYHPDTDISNLPTGHEIIDANDFIDTFRLALDEGWFRAISGGSDFINETSALVGAQEYLDSDKTDEDWEAVGIKISEDNLSIEFEFIYQMSDWNVKYWLESFIMTPINIELYDKFESQLTGEENNPYGTSNTTLAYSGAFYVDEYVEGEYIIMKEIICAGRIII